MNNTNPPNNALNGLFSAHPPVAPNPTVNLPWKVLSSDLLYEDPWMKLYGERSQFDGVDEPSHYAVIERRSFTAIVPITSEGKIVCIRTIRYATQLPSLEIPMGFIEGDEVPEQGARRELEEETGWIAGEIVSTGKHWASPAFMRQQCFSFVARNLIPGTKNLDIHEHVETEEFSVQQVLAAIQSGEISDATTIVAVLKAKERGFL